MAYDQARQQVVLFGGASGGYSDQTWVWNGTNWARVLPVNSPSARYYCGMSFDSTRNEIVLFGGTGGSGGLSDTWIWDGTNWTARIPASNVPSARYGHAMVYDEARRETVLFGGNASSSHSNDTWVWDGANWSLRSPLQAPPPRQYHALAYDATRHEVVLFGGSGDSGVMLGDTWVWDGAVWSQKSRQRNPDGRYLPAACYDRVRAVVLLTGGFTGAYLDDTWVWDGTDWLGISPRNQTVDVSARLDGTWNFTSLQIPAGLTISFKGNRGNTSLRWLASGIVSIAGVLDLSGWDGVAGGLMMPIRLGGPGGFAGGVGGTPSFQGSSPAGSPGQGPGGGVPGITNGGAGNSGTYASSYGNPFIQPLVGGSGGGGSAASGATFGNHGGGGGGAILIASSRDMNITGTIRANGGASYGGSGAGSGGAILLRADRITLASSGRLEATNDGRIRLESYERSILGTILPTNMLNWAVSGLTTNTGGAEPVLLVASVAGQNVLQPPGGDLLNPDVTFTAPGNVTVTVSAQNVPDGTPVTLRIALTGGVITIPASNEPPVLLSGGTATFSGVVPKGRGSMQAFAQLSQ